VEQGSHDSWLRRFTKPWSILGLLLVLFTVFGGVVQSGAILPKFVSPGAGNVGNRYLVSITNSSWRSWTITHVNLAGGQPTRRLPDGSTLEMSASYRGEPDFVFGKAPQEVSLPFDLGKGQTLTFSLVRSHAPSCKTALQTSKEIQRFEAEASKDSIDVPLAMSVATPLGSRNVGTAFNLTYGCP
jgi:hypothetical protein